MTAVGQTSMTSSPELKKTPLCDLHVSLGARMVDFAGYNMPVQYKDMGVLKEHLHTRRATGVFDVSHMGQAMITGDIFALEKITPTDIQELNVGDMSYSLLLNDNGGIVDDLIITRMDENTLYIVVNAACVDKDFKYINDCIGQDITLTPITDRGLIAVQGPTAERTLSDIFPDITQLTFMTSAVLKWGGIKCYISRSGYTGEDGFEISIPDTHILSFTQNLLKNDDVQMIGLGARDSLRLEAGLCLYGHDMGDTITPVEANLTWAIHKKRRTDKNFKGAEIILNQIDNGVSKKRVGILPEGKAPMREGTELYSPTGEKIGHITSGGFGPSVDMPIAMGYIHTAFSKSGTEVTALLRGTHRPCSITKLPFITPQYKKG